MKLAAVLTTLSVLIAGSNTSQEPQDNPHPLDSRVLDFYPPAARVQGLNGVAVVRCERSEHGAFLNCTLVSETPKDHGFGGAVLKFVTNGVACPTLSLSPSERRPHTFAFGFRAAPSPLIIEPDVMNAARSATYVIQAPSPADLAENYPRKAKEAHVTGRAVILCSADQRGDTRACALVDETPKGYGFGDAAMRMGSMFKVAPQPPNQCQYAPMVVIIPIEWKAR